jgi:hypothetical protein
MGNIKFQKSTFTGLGFMQVVEGLFNKCNQEEMVQFACLASQIWLQRNDVIHGGILSHPNTILQNTIRSVQEFTLAQTRGEQFAYQREFPFVQVWRAPAPDWCKENLDVALERESGQMGFGVVVRDSHGNLLAVWCAIRTGCLALAGVEAMAVLLAIQLCHEIGCSKVHLEGDAKGVIDAINSEDAYRSWMRHMIEDIKVEL